MQGALPQYFGINKAELKAQLSDVFSLEMSIDFDSLKSDISFTVIGSN